MVDDNKIRRYWPLETSHLERGYSFELRSALTWELIHHFGAVAGADGGEDSAGRAKLRLSTPGELVTRCYEITDMFMQACQERGEIRDLGMSDEEAAEETGRIMRIRSRAEYPVSDMPKEGTLPEDEVEVMKLRSKHAEARKTLRLEQMREIEEFRSKSQ